MEGDAKEYFSKSGDREWTDEQKGAAFAAKMSEDAPAGLAEALADKTQLARVRITSARGAVGEGTFDDAVYDKVFLYGARGFNIYKANAEGLSQVYTSGDAVEHYHMTHFAEIYNSEMNEDDFSEILRAGHDSRSDNKGSEPEGLAVATLSSGKRVVFVGSERTSVIGVFDISDPASPIFQSAIASGDSSVSFQDGFMAGGLRANMDPEDMHFIPAAESPLATDTLLVVGALNGVINLYTIDSAESEERSTYVTEKAAYVAKNGAGATKKTAADWACQAGVGGNSKVLEHFKMVGMKLADFNPFLSAGDVEEVPAANTCLGRNDQFNCLDFPSVFSGMSLAQGSVGGSAVFLGVSDNGPNTGCGNLADGVTMHVTDAGGKAFPVQNFSPIIAAVTLNSNGLVERQSSCYLKLKDGSPASGMPTSPSDDTPFGANCQTAQLSYDHNGFDPEDVHQIPGTPYCWAVEEYSPSAVVFNCDMSDSNMCGVVEARYVPESVKLESAGYKVHSILPDVYTHRRKNRGFEGGGVSPDGKLAYAFMQSPMLGDATNTILRFLEFDISDPLNAKVVGEYLYQGEDPAVVGNWASSNVAKDLKISGAQWYGEDMSNKHLLVLERANGQVKVFLVDLSSATNVLTLPDSATLSYEIAPADFAAKYAASVKTATKTIVFDTATTEGWTYSMKQEGFTLLNDCVMAFGDDNDFGLEGNTEAGVVTVQLGECVNTLAKRTAACKPYGAFTQGATMVSTPSEPN
jgi:alkaline phosphatase